MKHRVDTLEGAFLDAAVAKAEGLAYSIDSGFCFAAAVGEIKAEFQPTQQWQVGGAIIEREHIGISHEPWSDGVRREWLAFFEYEVRKFWEGPTPLIAAMRAFVASRFGEEVELP